MNKCRAFLLSGILLLFYSNINTLYAQINIHWTDEKQEIDGFGIAQAGWANRLYAHHKREEVMDMLFGEKGLQLNILRGEVFPHYWQDESDKNFEVNDNIDIATTDSFFNEMLPEVLRKGQLWITRNAKEVHHVEKLMFSTWSPPAYMKSNGQPSKGFLKPEYYQEYADYLVAFCKAYASVGLNVDIISPSNEPGYEAEWNSCKWSASEMGKFITQNLAPALKKENCNATILFGENCLWSTPKNPILSFVSSQKFVEDIIQNYPQIKDLNPIASGHGYNTPVNPQLGTAEDVASPIIPYTLAQNNGMKTWVTEISTIDALDASMENGLYWATLFHQYFTAANINAFVWWAGAMPTANNESLIVLNPDRTGYSLTKRYDTFGNFSRYIKSGSKRVETESKATPELLVSSYKKGKEFTVVIVNPTDQEIKSPLYIDGAKISGNLNCYTTNAGSRWSNSTITPASSNSYQLTIPPKSVQTFTGKTK